MALGYTTVVNLLKNSAALRNYTVRFFRLSLMRTVVSCTNPVFVPDMSFNAGVGRQPDSLYLFLLSFRARHSLPIAHAVLTVRKRCSEMWLTHSFRVNHFMVLMIERLV